MFFILSSHSFSFPETCYFHPSFPAPVPNMTLRHVELMTRHGERTPHGSYELLKPKDDWVCDSDDAISGYIDASPETHYRRYRQVQDPRFVEIGTNCRVGDLTTNGMKQHFNLGQAARKHYVSDLKFLPEYMDPSQFTFIASPYERTVKSAQSFLTGLYPPLSDNEVLNIQTPTESFNSLIPGSCSESDKAQTEFAQLNSTKEYVNTNWEPLKEIAAKGKIKKSFNKLYSICDWIVAQKCGQSNLPDFFTDEIFEHCQKVESFYTFDIYAYKRELAISPTLRQIFKVTDQIISGQSEIKFVLFSSHDLTIGAFMGFFGIKKEIGPPYASAFLMELYQDQIGDMYIRFIYNGEPLTLPDFGAELIRYDRFRSWAEPLIQHCFATRV